MRPDFVRPDLTPNLWRLTETGVRFSDSHSIFPTVTRVNSSCIATGCLPQAHGIPNNSFYLPAAEASRPLNTGNHADLERLRALRNGRILMAPALAELVHEGGGRSVVVGTGSPGSSLLLHPEAAARGDAVINPSLFVGVDGREVEHRFGPLAEREIPRTALNAYFTKVITDMVLAEMAPNLLYFWHTDPDATVHARGLGHADSLASIRDADTNLGSILDALSRLGTADETVVVVTSDHGFSTVRGHFEAGAALVEAGLKASDESADVLVTDGFVYVNQGGQARVEAIVRRLTALDGMGALYARDVDLPGVLPMSTLGPVTDLAPDIIYSPDWDDEPNQHGVPGCIRGATGSLANHGSLCRWEVRNTLVAAGPGLRQGAVSEFPAATVDIAPTLAHLLGIEGLNADGRILFEALADEDDPPAVDRATIRAAGSNFDQVLETARVGSFAYVDCARRIR